MYIQGKPGVWQDFCTAECIPSYHISKGKNIVVMVYGSEENKEKMSQDTEDVWFELSDR